jgi:hypothetical protein
VTGPEHPEKKDKVVSGMRREQAALIEAGYGGMDFSDVIQHHFAICSCKHPAQ